MITDVNVTLNGFSHTFPRDVDVLLVGPQGQKLLLLSDAGDDSSIANQNFTFDDAAVGSFPVGAVSGTYRPTDVDIGSIDTFPAPAPSGPYDRSLSTFNLTEANGTWSLFVLDDFSAILEVLLTVGRSKS